MTVATTVAIAVSLSSTVATTAHETVDLIVEGSKFHAYLQEVFATTLMVTIRNQPSTPMLFRLPVELQHLTLSFLSPCDLDAMFELDVLPDLPPDRYTTVRQMALYHYFSGRRITVSNTESYGGLSLILRALDYLIDNTIVIQPKEISLVLHNATPFDVNMIHYLAALKLYVPSFNVKLILDVKQPTKNQTAINAIFANMKAHGCNINRLYVSYSGLGQGAAPSSARELDQSFYNFDVQVEYLQLHLFDSQGLVNHLNHRPHCFLCDNLRSLDLSYNNLNDLSMLRFPPGLTYLNLSNNNLSYLTNSTFNWNHLTNLNTFNLSNNNLLHIDLRSRDNASYSLQLVDLAGNNLIDVGFLASPLFDSVEDIDLSHNLISTLMRFPPKTKKINLSSNYLTSLFSQPDAPLFPSTLEELDISWCKVSFGGIDTHTVLETFLHNHELDRFHTLNMAGNGREDRCVFRLP